MIAIGVLDARLALAGGPNQNVRKIERIDATTLHVRCESEEGTYIVRDRLAAAFPYANVIIYNDETVGLLG